MKDVATDALASARRLLEGVEAEVVRQRLQRAIVLWDLGYIREALSQFRLAAEDALQRLLEALPEAEGGPRRALLERGQAGKVIHWLHREAEVIPARVALHLHTLLAWGNYASHHQSGGHHAQANDLALLLGVTVDLEAWLAAEGKDASIFSEHALASQVLALDNGLAAELVQRVARSAGKDLELDASGLRIPHLSWELYVDRPTRLAAGAPFRGLQIFDLQDAECFWGRDQAREALQQRLGREPLTILSGVSGVGKTSLVRAGLLPSLLQRGHGALLMADYSAAALRVTLQVIGAWPAERMLTIVFDQLEQALLPEAPADVRRGVLELLLRAKRWQHSIRMLAVVREDHLGRLLREVQQLAPDTALGLEQALTMLGPLDQRQLREAICAPLPATGPKFCDELVDEVLLPALGESTPAQLQLVCSHLYQRALAEERPLIDARLYQRLGGAEQILEHHLDTTLFGYGAERTLATVLLKAMAGARARRWVELGALWQAATAASLAFVDEVRLVGILARLADDRLVTSRARREVGVVEYSLVHDQLALAIREWRSREELEQQQARELLDRAAGEWSDRARREPLTGRQLKLVEKHAAALRVEGDAASVVASSRRARLVRRVSVTLLLVLAAVGVFFGAWQLRRALEERGRAMRVADRGVLLEARMALDRDPSVAVALLRNLSINASGVGVLSVVEEARRRGVARVLASHQAPVSSVAFAPFAAGTMLVTAGHDRALRLWTKQGQPAGAALRGHEGPITSLAVSPDGRLAVSGDTERMLRLWRLPQGKLLGVIRAHDDWIYALAFAPDGKRFASASLDGRVRLWTASGQRSWSIEAHQGGVLAISFSPDGALLASAGEDGVIRLWRVSDGVLQRELRGHHRAVPALAFAPNGQVLVSGGLDTTLRFWDVEEGRPLGPPLRHRAEAVTALAFSPDGETLASAGEDKAVRLWDVRQRKEKGAPLRGHLEFIRALSFSPDGRALATASEDHTARLWNIAARRAKGLVLRGHAQAVHALAVSADGLRLASGGRDGEIVFWDLRARRRLRARSAHRDAVVALSFSPDASRLASAGHDREARLWELGKQAARATSMPASAPSATSRPLAPASHVLFRGRGPIYSVEFSPRGDRLLLGGTDTLRVFSVGGGGQSAPLGGPLLGHEDAVSAVAYSPDGSRFASASHDHSLRLWDAQRRRPLHLPLECPTRIHALAFSADGRWLAAAGADAAIHLFDVERWRRVGRALRGHQHAVYALAFSPRGRLLASAGADGTIRLWKGAGEMRSQGEPLLGHVGAIYALTFTPGGELLASGSADRSIRLWPVRPTSARQLRRQIDALTNLEVDAEGRVRREE